MARVMKDSGVQWIGQIPKEWGVVPVKRKYKSAKEIVGAREPDFQRLALTMNGIVKRPKESADGLQPEKFNTYQIIYNQELLFKLIDLENVRTSRIGRSRYTGIVSPVYIRLINPQESSYGFYFFTNLWHQEVFNYLGSGVRSSLNATDLLKMPYLNVPEEEQRKIVEFLDEKTSHIESIIEKTKASIDAFKRYKQALITETVTKGLNPDMPMKDSGVEWIGMIPEHWVPTMLKRFATVKYGLGQPPQLHEDGLPILRATNIERGHIVTKDLIRTKVKDIPKGKDVILKEGEILIVRSGAYAGDVARVSEEWDGALAGYDMVITLSEMDSIFITYALLSDYILKGQLYLSRMRSAQPHLNSDDVGKILVVIPPLDEQHQISTFLDEKTAHLDRLIQNKEAMIEKLEAYKKSLIYEYVTGKKEVE